MAIYYVSGIWTNADDVITALNIHLVDGSTVKKARRYSLAEAIALVKSNEVYTCNWNYATRSWRRGARVHVVNERMGEYLRSSHDDRLSDNLDNMLPMRNLGA